MDKKTSYLITALVVALGIITVLIFIMINANSKKGEEQATNNSGTSQEQKGEAKDEKVSVSEDDDPIKGNKDAKVTIIEFSDFECPYCYRHFTETLPKIEEEYIKTGKVKYVFRDFVLDYHKDAKKAAEAATCAGEQGKYWEMHDKLFQNQEKLSIENLKKYAEELGLNTSQFNECLDSERYKEEREKDTKDGEEYGVSGTPGFFINGRPVVGAQPFEKFKEIIEEELNK